MRRTRELVSYHGVDEQIGRGSRYLVRWDGAPLGYVEKVWDGWVALDGRGLAIVANRYSLRRDAGSAVFHEALSTNGRSAEPLECASQGEDSR